MRILFISLVLIGLTACSSSSNIEPPTELTQFKPEASLKILWQANTSYTFNYSRAIFSPHLGATAIFTAEKNKSVSAFSLETGQRIWFKELPAALTAGVSGNADNIFVVSTEGDVYALNQDSGEIVWQSHVGSEVIAAPTASKKLIVIRSVDGAIIALDANTGTELWRYRRKIPALTLRGNSRPVIVGGGVLVGFDDGRLIALRDNDGKLFWESMVSPPQGRSEIERINDLDAEIIVTDRAIYAAAYQGKIAQISPDRGRILWATNISSAAGFSLLNKQLFVTDENSEVLSLSTDTGNTLWKQKKLRARWLTAPSPIGDYLAMGDLEGYIHLLSQTDGHIVGRKKISELPFLTRPIVLKNQIFVMDRDGALTALRVTPNND